MWTPEKHGVPETERNVVVMFDLSRSMVMDNDQNKALVAAVVAGFVNHSIGRRCYEAGAGSTSEPRRVRSVEYGLQKYEVEVTLTSTGDCASHRRVGPGGEL